jgi:phosphatidylserine/phosphatidylglycerophosphate/cardiolipin synthase-like enzyme
MSRSLVVLPDDSAHPILDALHQAKESLRIKMCVFADPHIMEAVVKAHKRGVKVRVMLNPTRRSGEEQNDDTRKRLADAGIEVLSGSPSFDLTHEKSMVVDSQVAWVMSLNWDKKNLSETRDYALVTSHSHEVDEIVECFEADWARKPFEPGKDCHMIWCVGNARERIAQFIDNAQHTLFLQNERYQDAVIIERLVRASRRG